MIRVLIADDHELMRNGLRAILDAQPDIEVIGEAEHGARAVADAVRLRPDVVIMDIRMPRLDGIEATRRLAAAGQTAPRVLVLTTFDLDEYVYEALRAGAAGFLLKDTPPRQLADAVRTVAAGESLLAPALTRRLIERYVSRPPRPLRRADRPRTRGPAADHPRAVQRRDRTPAVPQRSHRQDPRHPDPQQTRRPRPRPGRRPRLRNRTHPTRRKHRTMTPTRQPGPVAVARHVARTTRPRAAVTPTPATRPRYLAVILIVVFC
jgi:DNA-binding NarL/FixJ family response regulator